MTSKRHRKVNVYLIVICIKKGWSWKNTSREWVFKNCREGVYSLSRMPWANLS